MLERIEEWLPPNLRAVTSRLPAKVRDSAEEVRVREGRPLEIVYGGGYGFLNADGSLGPLPDSAYRPSREDCVRLLELLTNHSVYSFEEELKRGFITVRGGHRVGLAGRTVLEHGKVKQIRDVCGFNIRLARELKDTGKAVLPRIMDAEARTVHHTLVVSPPQAGKTTLIRDLARLISYGSWPSHLPGEGRKVGIVDERSELAACERGVPRFDVGPRTDVMDGCPKAEGMMMMIRSMSPEVLIVDEIGREEDAEAVREAMHAGIRVIASAHGRSPEDILKRPALRGLAEEEFFGRFVVLSRRLGRIGVEAVLDAKGRPIPAPESIPSVVRGKG